MSEAHAGHEITFFVNNQPVTTNERELTGVAIKNLAGVPLDYELFEIRGNESISIGNDQLARIHEDLHFRAIPPGTFGTNVATS